MAALLLLVLLAAGPLEALDSLRVGALGQRWRQIMESSRFLAVSSHSIWIWPTQQYADLAPESLARKGSIQVEVTRPVGPGGALGPSLPTKAAVTTASESASAPTIRHRRPDTWTRLIRGVPERRRPPARGPPRRGTAPRPAPPPARPV